MLPGETQNARRTVAAQACRGKGEAAARQVASKDTVWVRVPCVSPCGFTGRLPGKQQQPTPRAHWVSGAGRGPPCGTFSTTPFNERHYHPTSRMRKLRRREATRPARDRTGVQACLDQSGAAGARARRWKSRQRGCPARGRARRGGGGGGGRLTLTMSGF